MLAGANSFYGGFHEKYLRRDDCGRARREEELKTVLDIIRATEGVKQVKHFVEIKPILKS